MGPGAGRESRLSISKAGSASEGKGEEKEGEASGDVTEVLVGMVMLGMDKET